MVGPVLIFYYNLYFLHSGFYFQFLHFSILMRSGLIMGIILIKLESKGNKLKRMNPNKNLELLKYKISVIT